MNKITFFNEKENTLENRCLAQINIAQKEAFYQSFQNVQDKDDFSNIVHLVGEMWGVLRTIVSVEKKPKSEKIRFNKLCDELWKSKEEIEKGEYKISSEIKKWPISYVSKICFLIAPEHYKFIYDEYNRRSLAEAFSTETTQNKLKNPEIFTEYVEKYYSEKKLDCSVTSIFETDCSLWIHGKNLKKKK